MAKPLLYDYWRSSASYRVRIALNLKGVDHDVVAVNLLDGEQKAADYRARNPQGFVPTLEVGDLRLVQSLAIIGWLEARHPEPRLLPADPADAAHVRAMALTVACDIHPLNNLRVLRRLSALGLSEAARDEWYRHWIAEGFAALEAMAAQALTSRPRRSSSRTWRWRRTTSSRSSPSTIRTPVWAAMLSSVACHGCQIALRYLEAEPGRR